MPLISTLFSGCGDLIGYGEAIIPSGVKVARCITGRNFPPRSESSKRAEQALWSDYRATLDEAVSLVVKRYLNIIGFTYGWVSMVLLVRRINSTLSAFCDAVERLLTQVLKYLFISVKLADPLFDRVEKYLRKAVFGVTGYFSSGRWFRDEVFERPIQYFYEVVNRSKWVRLSGALLAAAVLVFGYFQISRSDTSQNRASLLIVYLIIGAVSLYFFLTSRLQPLKAIIFAWKKVPVILKKDYLVFLVLFAALGFAALPSYLPVALFRSAGVKGIIAILGLNALPYFATPLVTARLTFRLSQAQAPFESRLNAGRILTMVLLAGVVAATILALRIGETLQLPIFRLYPVSRQLFSFLQYGVLAFFAFTTPALMALSNRPLRIAVGLAIKSLLPLTLSLIILQAQIPIFLIGTSVLQSVVAFHSFAWWLLGILALFWQSVVSVVTINALCLMFLWWLAEKRGF